MIFSKLINKKQKAKCIIIIGFVLVFLNTFIYIDYKNRENNLSLLNVNEPNETNEPNNLLPNKNYYIALKITILEFPQKILFSYCTSFLTLSLTIELVIILKKQKKSNNDNQIDINLNRLKILSDREIDVFNIIQDYLSKNRTLEKEKIVPFIKSRFLRCSDGLNNNGIEAAVEQLFKKNIIVDRSKYTIKTILENPNRLAVYKTIINNPGIHFMGLVSSLGMSIYLVKWHVTMLLKFKLVKKRKFENREIYFDYNLNPYQAEYLHFITLVKTQKILRYLKLHLGGCSKYILTKKLHIHPNTLTKYLGKLEKYNHVFSRKLPNKTLYFLNNNI
ncbi:MAG: hypothetical protein ACFE8M_13760 [Candidatus Hermodarchaeota archaeon]